jgi:hypothetical protein
MTTTLLPEKTSSRPNPILLNARGHSPTTDRRWTIFRRTWLISWLGVAAVLGLLAFRSPAPLKTKNIEDIQVGDMVLAEDPETGIVEPHRVLQLYRNTKDHLRIVNLTSADGNLQRIETTDEHPFWVASRDEWVVAHDLEPGDELLQADGQTAEVFCTVHEGHSEGISTYNFEVEGFHSYFVAAHGSTGPPVLVHNACSPPDFGTPGFGTEVHQDFKGQLVKQTGTKAKDWKMATGPGQTGVDATYVGPKSRDPGFKHAELKPASQSGVTQFFDQLPKWKLPKGKTQLWMYDDTGAILSTGKNF